MHDVVLITIDSLRADHVGCIEGATLAESLTPNIDEWANAAFVFDSAMSQSSHTSPSFLATLSGHYPCEYGDWFSALSPERVTIAELLKKNGYVTCAFNSNPYISRAYGFDKGFDFFEDNVGRMRAKGFMREIDLTLLRLKTAMRAPYETADKINRQVFSWLTKGIHPYFLWVHYMDVHGPYITKRGVLNRIRSGALWHKALTKPNKLADKEKRELLDTYKQKVRYIDSQVKILLDAIDSKNTIVVVLSDHGDLLGEHGLFGHPLKLYENLLHVPLLISIPVASASALDGKVIDNTVRNMDLLPTLLDILGLDIPQNLAGESLLPLMNGEPDAYSCEYFIGEVSRSQLCIKRPPWKLIVNYREGSKELFNLMDDPGEERNLVDSERDILAELERIIRDHIQTYSLDKASSPNTKIRDEIKAQLKGLGYMD